MSESDPGKVRTATVILFKESGKYYTSESWRVPDKKFTGPYDMIDSPDFRRIGGGAVLVSSDEDWDGDENWGFPHLFPGVGA